MTSSVTNFLRASPVFNRFTTILQTLNLPGKVEIEARVGKISQGRYRYQPNFLTESLVQVQYVDISDEDLKFFINAVLKQQKLPPFPSQIFEPQQQNLQFSPSIPQEYFIFLGNIRKPKFEPFYQKSMKIEQPFPFLNLRKREDINNRVIENIAKIRLANFDISTVFDFDYRISISLEIKVPPFVDSGAERRKRGSVIYQNVQCDMTEFGDGDDFQIELEGDNIATVVEGIREICCVLSDYCDIFDGDEPEKVEDEEELQEDISDEFD
ncbi:MRNA capping enzyme, beta chain [Spironucleus salmonicida]|uniref:mRNA 5'-phosphatase n=1 Tax=Spironucleus salmonicida TaxID=348837 RepID=V6LPS3_9EUKA|nr:MRNA capping enzyme, beta chain [Spironucleus salmonicida]|eukprot:EST46605.1 mRNA capping enzyme, beta chain [Spironucleus salmonicida]